MFLHIDFKMKTNLTVIKIKQKDRYRYELKRHCYQRFDI